MIHPLLAKIDGYRGRVAVVLHEAELQGLERSEPALRDWLIIQRANIDNLLRQWWALGMPYEEK